jgi:probable HAF family extracellular repeat protein
MNPAKSSFQFARFFVATIALLLSPIFADAQIYHLTDLGTVGGQQLSKPYAINNSSQVAGFSDISGFRYTNGVMEPLAPLPGGAVSAAFAINHLGQVAGESQFENGGAIRHAALWSNGTVIDLGTLPAYGPYGFAFGINSATQVVGYASPSLSSSLTRAFIWDPGTGIRDLNLAIGSEALSINDAGQITGRIPYTTGRRDAFILDAAGNLQHLGTLGGTTSVGNFINAAGHVAGTSGIDINTNRSHAFLYDGTAMRDLGTLGPGDSASDVSVGLGLNNHDEVVGWSYLLLPGGGVYQVPFIYRDGQMQNLETMVDGSLAGYRLFSANAINDAGQIVVDAAKAPTNQRRAVLLTPLQRLLSASSRKPHGAAGEFDIDLPLNGTPAVECRAPAGGGHTVVFTFANEVTGGNAAITEGTATINQAPTFGGKTITLSLSDVADRQTISITLSGVTDSFGQTMAPATVRMSLLFGDTTGNNSITASDVAQTKANVGQPLTLATFRTDVTTNGSINSSDIAAVKAASGAGAVPAANAEAHVEHPDA